MSFALGKPEFSDAIKQKSDFLTPSAVCEICRRLVLHYFKLTPEDLQQWQADPEDFGKSLNKNSKLLTVEIHNHKTLCHRLRYVLHLT